MIPITRANLQNFCRVCLCDISDKNSERNISGMETQNYLPNRMCSNCDIKLNALRKFRSQAIVATGILRVIVDEERQKSSKPTAILSKLQSICRICLKDDNLDSHSARDENFAIDIFECTGLHILETTADSKDILKDDPSFPDRFCNKCYTTIKSFIEFRTVSQQTADYLKSVFDEFENEQEISCSNSVKQENRESIDTNSTTNAKQQTTEATLFFDNSNDDYKDSPTFDQEREIKLEKTSSLENKYLNFEVPATEKCETYVETSKLTEIIYFNENSSAEYLNMVDKTNSDNELKGTNICTNHSKDVQSCENNFTSLKYKMLPITRANLQNFCRVCLCDIFGASSERNIIGMQTQIYLPNRMCMNCDIKLNALRKFRSQAIVATGILRVIVDEERLKSSKPTAILSKLQSICRICLKDDNLDSHSARDKNSAIDIFECTGLNVLETTADSKDVLKDDPSFPDRFCNKCYTTIKSFIEFRTVSQQTADYLKSVFDEFENEQEISFSNSVKHEIRESIDANSETNAKQQTVEATLFFDHSNDDYNNSPTSDEEKEIQLEKTASHEKKYLNFDGPATKKCKPYAETSKLTEIIYFNKNSSAEDLNLVNESDSDNELEESTNIFSNHSNSETEPDQPKIEVTMKDSNLDSNSTNQKASKKSQKAFKCVECSKSFYKKFMYEAHIKSEHENIDKPFSCPHCKSSFRLVHVLRRHMRCCHENIADMNTELNVPRKPCHTCQLCQSTFKRKVHLKEHIRAVHEKLEPFKCGTKNTQMRHKKNHSNDKPFSCEYCGRAFKGNVRLNEHISSVHQKLKPFTCSICCKSFGTKHILVRHERNHSSEKPFSCDHCDKRYNSKSELKVHIQSHTVNPEFTCSICCKSFSTKNTLVRHEKIHSTEKPFSCQYCDKRCNSKSDLNLHIQRHTANPELLCPICKRAQPDKEELRKHIERHANLCTICGKIFQKPVNLREHVETVHLKQKLYCQFCSAAFIARKSLKNHELSHNATNWPEYCVECKLYFKSKQSLLIHMKKSHVKLLHSNNKTEDLERSTLFAEHFLLLRDK